jgi:16S rRNA (guanine527-N7)-methyltransferase
VSDQDDPVSRPTVSRETAPSAPAVARRVFASGALVDAERFAELLAREGVLRGLIGPREVPRLWERHLLNSAVLSDAIPLHASVCDIGTGAGLPGLVVAIARRDLQITLVEPLLRRTTFLDEVVDELALDHVEVLRGRAEELHGDRTFDVVTSRAVAPLGRLLEWSMPLVSPSGALVAMKGQSVDEEVRQAQSVLRRYRCAEPEILALGAEVVDPPTRVVRVAWSDPSRVGWPLASTSRTSAGKPGKKRSRRARNS